MRSFPEFFRARLVENNQFQDLEAAKTQFLGAFQKHFQQDAQGALTWFHNLYTKDLPQNYGTFYKQWQQSQQQQPQQQPQQPAQQQAQQPQQAQPQQQNPPK